MESAALPVGLGLVRNGVIQFYRSLELIVLVWCGGEIPLIKIVEEREYNPDEKCRQDVVLPLYVGEIEIDCDHRW